MKICKIDLWGVASPILMLIICIITKAGWIQTVASITGVIYVSMLAKENKYGYLFATVNVILYAILTWQQGLFGTAIFNIIYTLPVLVYGYIFWNKNKGKDTGNIKRMNKNEIIKFGSVGILTIVIYYLIAKYILKIDDGLVDALIVAFSFIGNILVARKYIENWYVFIGLNVINIVFWALTSVKDTNSIALVGMYIIYLVNNIMGTCAWNKRLKQQ